jgi:hypothetical protein
MRRVGLSSRRDGPAASTKRIVWRWDAGRARALGLARAGHRGRCVRGPRSPTRLTRRTARLANARTDPAPGRPSARRLLKRRSRGTTRRHRHVDARGLSHRHGFTALTDHGTSRPSLPGLHPGRGSCAFPVTQRDSSAPVRAIQRQSIATDRETDPTRLKTLLQPITSRCRSPQFAAITAGGRHTRALTAEILAGIEPRIARDRGLGSPRTSWPGRARMDRRCASTGPG